jgi:hypothetical protein
VNPSQYPSRGTSNFFGVNLHPANQLIESEVSVKSSARILLAVALLKLVRRELKPLTRYWTESLHRHWLDDGAAKAVLEMAATAAAMRVNFMVTRKIIEGLRIRRSWYNW